MHISKLSCLIFFFVFLSVAFAQEQSLKRADVPKAILDAFRTSYPRAAIKGYSKETDHGTVVFEVESVEGKTHRDVSYTAGGSVVSVEESLGYKDVPQPVRDAVARDYPKSKVRSCEKVIKGPTTQFELLVQSGKQKRELVFNADGTLAEKEEK